MHFNDRDRQASDCIQQGNGGVRIGARIDYDSAAIFTGLLNPIDEFTFMIGLAEDCRIAIASGGLCNHVPYVFQSGVAINLRFSPTE